MLLYNSLTKKLETFRPINKQVRIYSCGPTVYDHIHIGNLSSFVYADTLRRSLAIEGYELSHLMNFTDVDDKTIKRSREEFPEMDALAALKKLTEKYTRFFLNDMKRIGNDVGAYSFVKATASMDSIRDLITDLYEAKFAYITEDGVYFSVKAYKEAGKTYGQLVQVLEGASRARIAQDEYEKAEAQDFALWKIQKDSEPAWSFNLNSTRLDGRPGWHIECSAMSAKGLGLPFDIHTGGVDLMFPHHENEIAQSTAIGSNNRLANYFIHNEHLLIDGKKMSKSLKNFYTLDDIIKKQYEPLAFRLLVLQSHYRSATNFTWDSLEAAQNRLKSLRAFADLRFQLPKTGEGGKAFDEAKNQIKHAINNDLATPEVFAVLSELQSQVDKIGSKLSSLELTSFIEWLDELLGLGLSESKDLSVPQKKLIDQRDIARATKDWRKSDTIRQQLLDDGIGLNDLEEKSIWYRL